MSVRFKDIVSPLTRRDFSGSWTWRTSALLCRNKLCTQHTTPTSPPLCSTGSCPAAVEVSAFADIYTLPRAATPLLVCDLGQKLFWRSTLPGHIIRDAPFFSARTASSSLRMPSRPRV